MNFNWISVAFVGVSDISISSPPREADYPARRGGSAQRDSKWIGVAQSTNNYVLTPALQLPGEACYSYYSAR